MPSAGCVQPVQDRLDGPRRGTEGDGDLVVAVAAQPSHDDVALSRAEVKRVLEAYLVSRAALVLAPRLGPSTASWKAVRNLREVLQGIKPGSIGDRAEYCVNSVDQALGYATGRYFVNEAFPGDSKKKGTKVITGA